MLQLLYPSSEPPRLREPRLLLCARSPCDDLRWSQTFLPTRAPLSPTRCTPPLSELLHALFARQVALLPRLSPTPLPRLRVFVPPPRLLLRRLLQLEPTLPCPWS